MFGFAGEGGTQAEGKRRSRRGRTGAGWGGVGRGGAARPGWGGGRGLQTRGRGPGGLHAPPLGARATYPRRWHLPALSKRAIRDSAAWERCWEGPGDLLRECAEVAP